MCTVNSFTDAGKEDFKTESATHPNEMNSQDAISEDSDSRMQNIHVAIKRVSMPANRIHSVWDEMDYHMDVARVTKEGHNGQFLPMEIKLQVSFSDWEGSSKHSTIIGSSPPSYVMV
ncbi:hypothetical protein AVEN_154231-1 [Araneus ventricosus]|uniref:Uncharacterized protein n=1 Tax=Araneus ventricosus TaxID=182803 RepID=A0A4Y2VF89_ARAVE|nr:hypothetical protein AVEN_154231-1 [Araneus ventricosus]